MAPSDWMEMTPSDWMSMAPSDWMQRTFSGWNRSYADWMNMKPADWWAMMSPPGMRMPAWSPAGEWERRRHKAGCECEDCRDYSQKRRYDSRDRCRRCGSDSCECYCCIGDVDLAVYALFGEQRVIPIVVENERHRDTQISLELSPWTTSSGAAAPVETVVLEPKTFTLPPCGEQKVILVVSVRDVRVGDNQGGEERPGGQDMSGGEDKPSGTNLPEGEVTGAAETAEAVSQRQPRDIDQCLVATADLRLAGCDHRPLRIAVAILPRNCDPYRVSCGCTCC